MSLADTIWNICISFLDVTSLSSMRLVSKEFKMRADVHWKPTTDAIRQYLNDLTDGDYDFCPWCIIDDKRKRIIASIYSPSDRLTGLLYPLQEKLVKVFDTAKEVSLERYRGSGYVDSYVLEDGKEGWRFTVSTGQFQEIVLYDQRVTKFIQDFCKGYITDVKAQEETKKIIDDKWKKIEAEKLRQEQLLFGPTHTTLLKPIERKRKPKVTETKFVLPPVEKFLGSSKSTGIKEQDKKKKEPKVTKNDLEQAFKIKGVVRVKDGLVRSIEIKMDTYSNAIECATIIKRVFKQKNNKDCGGWVRVQDKEVEVSWGALDAVIEAVAKSKSTQK